jgi:hypothetical protein
LRSLLLLAGFVIFTPFVFENYKDYCPRGQHSEKSARRLRASKICAVYDQRVFKQKLTR